MAGQLQYTVSYVLRAEMVNVIVPDHEDNDVRLESAQLLAFEILGLIKLQTTSAVESHTSIAWKVFIYTVSYRALPPPNMAVAIYCHH